MQATAVATVNAMYDWVASEAKRVMGEVLDVRAMERRHTVTPPVARAQQADERDGDDADAAAYAAAGAAPAGPRQAPGGASRYPGEGAPGRLLGARC